MMRSRSLAMSVFLLVAGCGGAGATIVETPAKWDDYADQAVTVRGNAGNSRLGPIVRFGDGGYIALRTTKPWSLDALGRPVEVTGRVVSGQGFRAEKFVLEADKIALVAPSADAGTPMPDRSVDTSVDTSVDAPAESPQRAPIRLPTPPTVKETP